VVSLLGIIAIRAVIVVASILVGCDGGPNSGGCGGCPNLTVFTIRKVVVTSPGRCIVYTGLVEKVGF
jgi:hypothetical protein